MKNKKLNLDKLKVSSFVTAQGNKEEETIKGGKPIITTPDTYPNCSFIDACPSGLGTCGVQCQTQKPTGCASSPIICFTVPSIC